MKKFPIGLQSFEKIINGGYLYVDKTEEIYRLLQSETPYFLSRPRRFGKSLLISTLEAIFLARKNLFKNLWIESSDWNWQGYPVIRLDMSLTKVENAGELKDFTVSTLVHEDTLFHLGVMPREPGLD